MIADATKTNSITTHSQQSKESDSAHQSKLIHVGMKAPNFSLKSSPEQKTVTLKLFEGRPVVIFFYPADFSPVCGTEVELFNKMLPEFERYNAVVLGISVDNVWTHVAYAREKSLLFPLLADFHPKGEVSKKYGAYREQDGTSERALVVIDEKGIVRWSFLSVIDENPGTEGIFNVLKEMNNQK